MISFNNVSFTYPKMDYPVLSNINFNFNGHGILSILGESGVGKSTIVKLIFNELKSQGITSDYDNKISYLPQSGNLLPYLNCIDNIRLHCEINKVKLDKELLVDLLLVMNLSPNILTKYPRELSGGQYQRVSIINALIIPCKCLILDEAFSALDPITRHEARNLILKLKYNDPELDIIIITHDIDEAIILSDKILVLNKSGESGIVSQFGTPTELVLHPADNYVDNLMNRVNFKCQIHKNSWRIAAIKMCESLNRSEVEIVDDDNNIIDVVSLSKLRDSLKVESEVNLLDINRKL